MCKYHGTTLLIVLSCDAWLFLRLPLHIPYTMPSTTWNAWIIWKWELTFIINRSFLARGEIQVCPHFCFSFLATTTNYIISIDKVIYRSEWQFSNDLLWKVGFMWHIFVSRGFSSDITSLYINTEPPGYLQQSCRGNDSQFDFDDGTERPKSINIWGVWV